MTAKWGSCAILVLCLVLPFGCRTPQPVLKPEKAPEKLVEPPQEARYDVGGYPKQALNNAKDPLRRDLDAMQGSGVMPTRGGSMGSPGAGSMGSMGGYR